MKNLQNISLSEAMEILHQLDLLLLNHDEWFSELTKNIILNEDINDDFISENPHELCNFGKWFYNDLPPDLRQAPISKDIELIHKNMHLKFKDILVAWKEKKRISKDSYNEATVKKMAFMLTVNTLQFMIYDYLLQTDPLTKTLNRTKLLSTLERERNRISETGESCAVVMADIDYFKKVNDTYGHAVGDMVLVQTALFFSSVLRPMDLVFRYGGEEFLIYMSNLDLISAIKTLDRIREKFATNKIMISTGKMINITASFGVAMLDPKVSIDSSIKKADLALYAAKRSGRNCVKWQG
ncbi:MAG: diguanylate cyclase [Magnetococcales bacterium]|nr:diguanylate cyclase [Magnetococcales bacterium]